LQQLTRGLGVTAVALNLHLARKTVGAIAYRYQDDGIERALYEKPRPGARQLLDSSQKQRIIAMVRGPAPVGQARWTVRLIVQEAMRRKLVATVGRETIRVLLESHELQPWWGKNVVRGRAG
jgi:putative transposase